MSSAVHERRFRRVLISPYFLATLAAAGEHPAFFIDGGVPEGAELVDTSLIMTDGLGYPAAPLTKYELLVVCLKFAHPDWEPVEVGDDVPVLPARARIRVGAKTSGCSAVAEALP